MTEPKRIRVKAEAKLKANGWVGICRVWFGDDIKEKRGPHRLTLDEAEADAQQLLDEFHEMMMSTESVTYLGTDKQKKEAQ